MDLTSDDELSWRYQRNSFKRNQIEKSSQEVTKDEFDALVKAVDSIAQSIDAYKDSTSNYDEEDSMDGEYYEMPYGYQDPPNYGMPYHHEDHYWDNESAQNYYEDYSIEEQGFGVPQGYNDEDISWSEESFEDNAQPTRYNEEYLWHEQGSLSNMNEERRSQEESHLVSALTQILANQAQEQEETNRIHEELKEIYESQEKLQTFLSTIMDESEEVQVQNLHKKEARYQSVETCEEQASPSTSFENLILDHEVKCESEESNHDDQDLVLTLNTQVCEDSFGTKKQELVYSQEDDDFFSDDDEMLDIVLMEEDNEVEIIEPPKDQVNDNFNDCDNACELTRFEEEFLSQETSYKSLKLLIELEDAEFNANQEFEATTNKKEFDHHSDLVHIFKSSTIEQPPDEVDNRERDNPRSLAHMRDIGDVEVSIELDNCVEDPFFPTLEQNKFQAFQPFISIPFGRRSYNLTIRKGEHFIKGLEMHRKVHLKLGGREFKWDLKRDKIYSWHHLRRDPSKGLLKCVSGRARALATS